MARRRCIADSEAAEIEAYGSEYVYIGFAGIAAAGADYPEFH